MLSKHRPHAPSHTGPSNGSSPRSSESTTPAPTGGSVPSAHPEGFPDDPITGGLVHVGLTAHEAQMYHTLLRHGPSTARFAIQQSRLDRATGYRILSRLRARGLVTATGYRPQRFVAMDATRLLDRVTSILRDELEMHRVVREIYAAGLPPPRDLSGPNGTRAPSVAPELPRPPGLSLASRYRLLPGNDGVNRFLLEAIGHAKEEIGGLMRPALVPDPDRSQIGQALVKALTRNVRVRLVLDYHPTDLEFLTNVLRDLPETNTLLEVRFFAPQLARLFVLDRRSAVRCLSPLGAPMQGSTLGIVSEDLEFVRVQSARFQTTWREAVPLETALRSPQGSVMAPPSSSQELRQWVERVGHFEPRGYPMDAMGFQASRVFRS